MGEVAIRVVDCVCIGLGETAKGDQVRLRNCDASLLGQLVDCGSSKAPTWLGSTGRQTPGSIIGPLGQQNALVFSLESDHRTGHEDEVIAHLLSQPPEVRVSIRHSADYSRHRSQLLQGAYETAWRIIDRVGLSQSSFQNILLPVREADVIVDGFRVEGGWSRQLGMRAHLRLPAPRRFSGTSASAPGRAGG